jgi:hypothetical protein
MSSQEALAFQQGWNAYLLITASNNIWSKSMGFRKNSVFPSRLIRQVRHCLSDWSVFDSAHTLQYDYFKKSTTMLNTFVFKYFLSYSP